MDFTPIDGCPCPNQIYPALLRIKQKKGLTYTSIYRGSDRKAAGILKRFGKSTQAWLFKAYWVLHLPGFRPANRPGQSTHECFNDGVAFPGPAGMPLPGYKVGIDSTSGALFVEGAHEEGYDAMLTYPGSPLESQHANLKKQPKGMHKLLRDLLFTPLKGGDKGPRVRRLRKNLAFVHSPMTKKPYLDKGPKKVSAPNVYGAALEAAVAHFQRDHGQKVDGIYGRQTQRQLAVSVRHRKKKLKDAKRAFKEATAKGKRKKKTKKKGGK